MYGLYGLVGAGRSEVMRAVYGVDRHDSGEVLIGNKKARIHHPKDSIRRGVSMVTEDRLMTGIISILSVRENMSLANLPSYCNKLKFVQTAREEREVDKMVERMNVKLSTPAQPIGSLSGGNQQKAIVAREIDKNPELLVAVQPTRGLDVGAIEYIHKQLVAQRDAGKAVLLVSLELDEVMDVPDRILVMYEGEIVGELDPKATTQEELGLYMAGAKRDEVKA